MSYYVVPGYGYRGEAFPLIKKQMIMLKFYHNDKFKFSIDDFRELLEGLFWF